MLESNKAKASDEKELVTLESIATMTGFPVKMIKEELFAGSELNGDNVMLGDLREAMLRFLDKTMLEDEALSSDN